MYVGIAGWCCWRIPRSSSRTPTPHGRKDDPQYVYAVQFLARDLWGEGDHVVMVDLFEPYLEQAA